MEIGIEQKLKEIEEKIQKIQEKIDNLEKAIALHDEFSNEFQDFRQNLEQISKIINKMPEMFNNLKFDSGEIISKISKIIKNV